MDSDSLSNVYQRFRYTDSPLSQEVFDGLPEEAKAHIRALQERNSRLQEAIDKLTEAKKAISHQVGIDTLTGIPNRLAFEGEAARWMTRMKRHQRAVDLSQPSTEPVVTFIAVDLDGFKQINDTSGHAAGDKALQKAAKILDRFRGEDFVARTGGDEFAIIIACDAETARLRMDALRKEFEQAFTSEHGVTYLSFSFGVRQLRPEDTDIAKVIDESDRLAIAEKEERKKPREQKEGGISGQEGGQGRV